MLFGLFTTAGEIERQYKKLDKKPVQDKLPRAKKEKK